ncbi:MAG TPA: class E sortase [Microlunatus sp.]|nr:class E sortase [Microlunatus sp.]
MTAPTEEEPRTTSRRRRPSVMGAVGLLLVLSGLGCLGWVAYQYVGTNVVSRQAFRQETSELRDRWATDPPAPVPSVQSSASASGTDRDASAAVPGNAIALLRVPKFGDGYEVPILEGTDLSILSRGVGHYTATALPGQVGNFAIAGHRVTHGQPFARLLELGRGDRVIIETRSAVYVYVLDTAPRDLTVDESATWVLDPVPGEPGTAPVRALITLTTCQDLFHSPDRAVAFGHLESTRNKT